MTEKPLRTMVFVDAQNVYRTAREAFGWEEESSRRGNFRPLALGELLTQGADRDLVEVRVYTGVPSLERDEQGYRASRRRFDTWKYEGHGKVAVRERNLQYRPGQDPREKGVDVLLAIELVRFAGARMFDLAVVMSADNDLVPALELVCDVLGSPAVEAVSLQAERGYESAPALGVGVTEKRKQIARRMLTKDEYERIEDIRSYNPNAQSGQDWKAGPDGTLPGQSGRRLPPRR